MNELALTLEVPNRYATATALMMAMLIDELSKRGAIDKGDFAKLLSDTANVIHEKARNQPGLLPRHEALLLQKTADMIGLPPEKWTPEVIEGGKA